MLYISLTSVAYTLLAKFCYDSDIEGFSLKYTKKSILFSLIFSHDMEAILIISTLFIEEVFPCNP
jgi:hypothetical protein